MSIRTCITYSISWAGDHVLIIQVPSPYNKLLLNVDTISVCQCDRCKNTTGKCFSYTTMHPGRPKEIQKYDICSRCNDDFDRWFRYKT